MGHVAWRILREQMPPSAGSRHLLVPVKVQVLDACWLLVYVIINLGDSQCYMGAQFVTQHQVPLCSKGAPTLVEGIDSWLLLSGPLTQEIKPLVLQLQHHHEQPCFDIVFMPHFPIVLGIS